MNSKKLSNIESKQKQIFGSKADRLNDQTATKDRTLSQLSSTDSTIKSLTDNSDDDDEDLEVQSPDKMKTIFMSLWNNVKFGLATKLKTRFSYDSPICLLGQFYHKKLTDSTCESGREDNRSKYSAIDKFKHDFYSRIWLTYRREFPKLANSSLTTDCGWGCMLRSGQMVLAQALLTHYLGRQWRWKGSQSDKEDMIHRMIVKWFADDPNSASCPFSVHQLVKYGEQLGKKPGDWYGPASVAHLLKIALSKAAATNPILNNICCYVAQDCTVYIEDVVNLCTSTSNKEISSSGQTKNYYKPKEDNNRKESFCSLNDFDVELGVIANEDTFQRSMGTPPKSRKSSLLSHGKMASTFNLSDSSYSSSGPRSLPFSVAHNSLDKSQTQNKWKGLILIVPVRLGSDRLNPIYTPCVKQMLSHYNCLGIIGGKPKHSLYFIGFQEDKLVYMDPHYCQPSVDVRQTNFSLDSFHCEIPRKTSISCMDPSCALAFYCRSQSDFFDFVNTMQELLIPPNQTYDYPIFVFNNGSNECNTEYTVEEETKKDRVLRVKNRLISSDGRVRKEINTEEFVML